MTADLAAWLLADDGPIAEDEAEQRARLAGRDPEGGGPWGRWGPTTVGRAPAGHPDRVLAECAAERAVVEHYQRAIKTAADFERNFGEPDEEAEAYRRGLLRGVHLLAQPYAGRPGWREEWGT